MEHNINELCVECLHPHKAPTLFEFPIQSDDFNGELKNVCATKLQNSALSVYSIYIFSLKINCLQSFQLVTLIFNRARRARPAFPTVYKLH